jgi:hypothetical protein
MDSIKILLLGSSSIHLDLPFIAGILKRFVQHHVLSGRKPVKRSVNSAHADGSRFCENYSFGVPSANNDNHIQPLRLHVSAS